MSGFLDYWRRTRAELLFVALVTALLTLYFGFEIRWPFDLFYLGATILSVAALCIWAAAIVIEHKKKKRDAR